MLDREALDLWGGAVTEAANLIIRGGSVARCFQCVPSSSLGLHDDAVVTDREVVVVEEEGGEEAEEEDEADRWREEKMHNTNDKKNAGGGSIGGVGGRKDKESRKNKKGEGKGKSKTRSVSSSTGNGRERHSYDGDNSGDDTGAPSDSVSSQEISLPGDEAAFAREASESSKGGKGGRELGGALATGVAAALLGAVLSAISSSLGTHAVDDGGGTGDSTGQFLFGTKVLGNGENVASAALGSSGSKSGSAPGWSLFSPRLSEAEKWTAESARGAKTKDLTDRSPLYGVGDGGRLGYDAGERGRGEGEGGRRKTRDGASSDGWMRGVEWAGAIDDGGTEVASELVMLKPASFVQKESGQDTKNIRPTAGRALQVREVGCA